MAKRNARPAKKKAPALRTIAKPKTASGKQLDHELLKKAEEGAIAGTIERVRVGEEHAGRPSGPMRRVDESIRDFQGQHGTADAQLLGVAPAVEFTHTDPWRVLRITAEFIEGFDRLADVTRGVAMFGCWTAINQQLDELEKALSKR